MADPPEKTVDDLADEEAKKIRANKSPGQIKKEKELQQQQAQLNEREKRIKQGEQELSDVVGDSGQSVPETGLEGKTQGFFQTLKDFSAWDWLKVGAVNAAGAFFGGGIINLATTTLSYVTAHYLINRKKGFEKKSLMGDMYLGAAMTPALNLMFNALHAIANPLARWGAWLVGGIPIMSSYFLGAQHVIKEYSPLKIVKGLFTGETYKIPFKTANYVRKNLWAASKELLKYFAIPFYFVLNHAPLALNIPISSVGRVGFRYLVQKGIDKNNPNYKKESPSPAEYATRPGR